VELKIITMLMLEIKVTTEDNRLRGIKEMVNKNLNAMKQEEMEQLLRLLAL